MGEKIKVFKITTNKRYWEDEDFGILVKRGAVFDIYPKHLRSYLLKFAIMRGDVILLKDEKCMFGFKGRIFKIIGGDKKNLITIIQEDGKKVNKKYLSKSTKESIGSKLKPDIVITVDDPKSSNK